MCHPDEERILVGWKFCQGVVNVFFIVKNVGILSESCAFSLVHLYICILHFNLKYAEKRCIFWSAWQIEFISFNILSASKKTESLRSKKLFNNLTSFVKKYVVFLFLCVQEELSMGNPVD